MDEAGFDRLLTIAGPDMARELVHQFRLDLASGEAELRRCYDRRDWTTLHQACHALTGLAGTAGAVTLHSLCRDLNTRAHDGDQSEIATIWPEICDHLEQLRRFLDAQMTGMTGTP